ncbi:MAG: SdrD B-like domain-containing protein [Acidobacteriota bacterium]
MGGGQAKNSARFDLSFSAWGNHAKDLALGNLTSNLIANWETSAGFTLTNSPAQFVCPTITIGTPANGTTFVLYSSSVAATAVPAPPAGFSFRYSLVSGALPNGLSLNTTTGAITGTPTSGGSFAFGIKAELFDAANTTTGCSITQARSIGIGSCEPLYGCQSNNVVLFCDLEQGGQTTFVERCVATQSCTLNTVGSAQCIANPSGRVWMDSNRNGVQDAGEPGIQGVTVTMINAGANGIFGDGDDRSASATTDSNGVYIITPPTMPAPPPSDVLPVTGGNVRFVVSSLPAGFASTFDPDSGTTNPDGIATYNNTPQGTLVTNVHFGFAPPIEPSVGPGALLPEGSPMNDQRAGSVLIYNVYTSGASDATLQNTRINLTNTHPTRTANVHLFFVDGTSCSVADSYICLTANQTTSFLASDLDPGTTGYVVAVATDAAGCPINFNYLIGDEYAKFTSGHAANLGAEAIPAIAGGLAFCNQNSVTATINFDGFSYGTVPRALAADNLPSRADGNDTLLILNRIGGNLATGASTLGTIFGVFYNDAETSLSFSLTGGCQFRSAISNNFPRLTPRFEQFIPAGRTGWFKLYSQSDFGLSGAILNANPNATTTAGAFNQGHSLHKLTLTSAASYVIPIFAPGC